MKRTFTLAAVILIFLSSYAQTWIEVGTGSNALNANYIIFSLLADTSGNIYAAGGFTDSASYITGTAYVAKWNGNTWSTLDAPDTNTLNANNAILTMTQDLAGNIYAAGNFTDNNGYQYVAKWNGTTWSELGTNSASLNANFAINALTTDINGNVYAAGNFTDSLGYYFVAEWNGSAWSEMGIDTTTGLKGNGSIYALTTDHYGNVYAAGQLGDSLGNFYVAKWNGIQWSEVGTDSNALKANAPIYALISDTAGNLYAGGAFQDSAGNYYIAKWNGTKWTELENPALDQTSNFSGSIFALAMDAHGNVYSAGAIADTNGNFYHVNEWKDSMMIVVDDNGASMLNANNTIQALVVDKNGNLYAAGQFIDATDSLQYVAEYDYAISGIAVVNTDNLHIYPNPTSGILYINADHLSGTSTLQILDGLGRPLYSQATEGSTIHTMADMSGYATGVYTLLIRDDAGSSLTSRIVKE